MNVPPVRGLQVFKLVGKDGTQDVYATVIAENLEQAEKLVTQQCWGFRRTQGGPITSACSPHVVSIHKH